MHADSSLVADPSNAGAVAAWDGNEGALWAAKAERFDETLRNMHGLFLDAAAIREDDHVLDIGCGNGQTTRDAGRLAVNGFVLGVDLSSEMLALARSTAAAEGLGNVEFAHGDAQIYPFPSGRFDTVISRMGSMFFGDPIAAFSNLRGALRPRGRLTLLTWQGLDDNEWITELRSAMAVGRELPKPPPEAPGPFSLADPGRVRAILAAAGFVGISLRAVHEPMSFGLDPDDAFDFASDLTRWMRDGLEPTERDAGLQRLRASIADHTGEDGVTYQSATWIVEARTP